MRHLRIAIVVAAAVAVTALSAQEAAPPAAGEWPMYNRDLMGTRHSPLTRITPANVSRLRQMWSYRLGRHADAARLDMNAHAVPITYQRRDGKQYVAVGAAGGSALDAPAPPGSEALVVFALP